MTDGDAQSTARRIGYTYAGRAGPTVEEQRAALLAEAAAPIYHDDYTPARKPRYWRDELRRALRPGDTLILYSVAVLGTNDAEAGKILEEIAGRGVGLVVIDADVHAPEPAAAVPVFAAFRALRLARKHWNSAQWEPGLRAARKKPRAGGGPKPKLRGVARDAARALWFDLTIPPADIEEQYGVDYSTLWRAFGPRERQSGELLSAFRERQAGRVRWTQRGKKVRRPSPSGASPA